MFEFVCDHIVPGCTTKERGDTPEAVREKALKHLHDHDGFEYIDDNLMDLQETPDLIQRNNDDSSTDDDDSTYDDNISTKSED